MQAWQALWILAALAQAQPAEPPEIPKYLEVGPKVGTGGQPTPEGIRLLRQKGYSAVINLRTANEGVDLAAEEKLARDAGLSYFNIPVSSSDPQEGQALEFLKLLDQLKDDKVFVHCAAANRVGGFMMIQWVVKEGVPIGEAERRANRVGLQSEKMREFARGVIARHKHK